MGNILASFECGRLRDRRSHWFAVCGIAFLMTAAAGCRQASSANTQMLDRSGMDYASVQQIRGLNVSANEVEEVLKMHDAGFSDATCVRSVQIYHNRGQAFRADEIMSMRQAGMSEQTVFALAQMNDFGKNAGELEAMHLAGLSDAIVMEVAKRRADGEPVLSGASLAAMKNAGVRNSTLLELVRRGVPDSQANGLIASRRHGATDAQILRRYSGS